jgi:hypothetical protein
MRVSAKITFKVAEQIGLDFKLHCMRGGERGIGKKLEGLLKDYTNTPIGSLILNDRDASIALATISVTIDRSIRSAFKSRCVAEELSMEVVIEAILREYLLREELK